MVWLNEQTDEKPPPFYLPTTEDMAYLTEFYCGVGKGGLWATHVDISNCYWGFRLPKEFEEAFRLSLGNLGEGLEGETFALLRLPFGWKFSPVLCQRVLQFFLEDLKKGADISVTLSRRFYGLRTRQGVGG